MSQQADTELRVFKSFAQVSGLPVNFGSIENRDPPEPDIYCEISEVGPVAFELLEMLDQDRIARPLNIQVETMDGFKNGFQQNA